MRSKLSRNGPQPAVTMLGDLFVLGDHRLLCGDSLLLEAFETLMQGEAAAVCFTDPPYNVPVVGNVSGLGKVQHREFAMASGEMSDQQFADFLQQSMTLIARSASRARLPLFAWTGGM